MLPAHTLPSIQWVSCHWYMPGPPQQENAWGILTKNPNHLNGLLFKPFKGGNGTTLRAINMPDLLLLHLQEKAHFSCLDSMYSSLLTAVLGKCWNTDWLENWAVSPSSSEQSGICITEEAPPINQFVSHSFFLLLVNKTLGCLTYFKRPNPKQPMSLSFATP